MIMNNKTLLLIKPNALNHIGIILNMVEQNGFSIGRMKKMRLCDEKAAKFYAIHKDKHFYKELVNFMTSDDIVAVELFKNDAVNRLRELIGATNFNEAKAGTIRYLFADGLTENAVHGSDSNENAEKELAIIFDN